MNDSPTIDVPAAVLVRCPKVEFKLRSISHCPPCEHFRGLVDRGPGIGTPEFAKRYLLLCAAEPVRRELFEVEA